MKIRFVFLLIVCLIQISFVQSQVDSTLRQDKSIKKVHYGFSINQSLVPWLLPTSFLFTINWKKHQLDLGPQFQLGRSIDASKKDFGIELNYHFYPSGDDFWYSSYILFNTRYFYEYWGRTGGYYSSSDPILNGQQIIHKNITNTLGINLGYGVKFRVLGGFYLGLHVGFGANFSFDKDELIFQNLPSEDRVEKDQNVELGFLVAFFIGYKF